MTSDQSSVTEPECSCFPVANPWTYFGIVEPGGAMEQNPECAVHGDVAYMAGEIARIRSELEAAIERYRHGGLLIDTWISAYQVSAILNRPAGGER